MRSEKSTALGHIVGGGPGCEALGPEVASGMADAGHADLDVVLRDDIRRLGRQLGDTLVRQEGVAMFDRVEAVRAASRSAPEDGDGTALYSLLADLTLTEAIPLARAFTTYFHLANLAEQVHRGADDLVV